MTKQRSATGAGAVGTAPSTGAAARVSRSAILQCALRIVDRDGVDGLSMRRLSDEVGRGPTVIYRHVPNKAALLDGVAEIVLGQLRVDTTDPDWTGQLRAVAHDFRRLALAHPNVVPLLVTRPLATPLGQRPIGMLRPLDDVLTLLTSAGFSGAHELHIYRMLVGYLHGHILTEMQEVIEQPDETDDVLRLGLHRVTQFPHVRALASALANYDGAAELDRGLDILLFGLTATATSPDGLREADSAIAPRTRKTAPTRGPWECDRATSTPGQCHSCPTSVRLDVAIADQLLTAVDGRRGVEAADRLCEACVVLLDIDAAAVSLVFDGAASGTFGSSGGSARMYDELQFTLGEGPCLDSVALRTPILVADLADPDDTRWPVYGPAMLAHQIRGVFAMPVLVAGKHVGALDLFRAQPGHLEGHHLTGAIAAAELAGVPLLDLMNGDLQAAVNDPDSNAWAELRVLSRAEVSQATGMLVAQLGVGPAEALVRLRAHAYATGRSSTDVARDILDRRLKLEAD